MFKPIATLATAFLVAAALATGTAEARTVTIGGFIDQTFHPTDDYYTSGLKSGGPGDYKVRDAKTGKLITKGRTDTKSGKYTGPKGEDVNSAQVELLPGDYIIDVWQTDPRGKRFKATTKLTIKTDTGSEGVILKLTPQSKSEIAMDQARTIKDKIDFLKYAHDHALAAAVIAKNDKEFKNATSYAKEIWDEMNELWESYFDKRQEAARFAAQAKKPSETAMAEAKSLKTKLDALKKEHDAALDEAVKSKTGAKFQQATDRASKLWAQMNAVWESYLNKRQEAARLATEENKKKTGTATEKKAETSPKSGGRRAKLEEQQSRLEQEHDAQTARLASFTPEFLRQRQSLLAELPAATRTYLEGSGGTDPAGFSAVKYTRLKIQIEMAGAANEGSKPAPALVKLRNLYDRMGGHYSAVFDTDARIAQTQKDIADSIVDETSYSMGGEGGEGGGGDGGGGGGGEGGGGN